MNGYEYPKDDELLDIVNEQDEVIGQKWRSEVYAQKLNNFRVINGFIQNDKGELWIPRRTKHKRIFPLALDASVAGHVGAGESYQDGLRRELMEELTIDLSLVAYKELGMMTPHKHGASAFMHVYLFESNNAPHYNRDDFFESFWMQPQDLLNRLDGGDPCKDDLPKMVRHLFM